MRAKSFVSLSLLAVLAVVACERNSRPLGGRGEPLIGSSDSTVEPSVSLVRNVSFVEEVAPAAPGDKGAADPAALYVQNCGACHQPTGQGVPGVFPPLDKSPYVLSDNTERMASIMIYGLVGPINVLGTQYQSAMAPLGATLNDEQLATIATYVRSAWSNDAGPIEASVFAAAREKWGTRGPFSIQELGEEQ